MNPLSFVGSECWTYQNISKNSITSTNKCINTACIICDKISLSQEFNL